MSRAGRWTSRPSGRLFFGLRATAQHRWSFAREGAATLRASPLTGSIPMKLALLALTFALASPTSFAADDPHFDALVKAERDFAADSPKIGIWQSFAKHFGPDA